MRIVFRVVSLACLLTVGVAGPATAGTGQDAAAEKGKAVYAAQKCSMCHGIAGAGGKTSPLDGVGKKLSAADIRAWIVTPKEMERNRRCPTVTANCRRRISTRWSPTCPPSSR
jgi:mono/diheme cytochrome c family protein